MKILVIQQKMIGDVLVSTLLCNNLRKAYPNAQIDYMVYKSTLPVLQGNNSVDNYILFERKHRRSKLEFFKLIYQVRKEKYDLVIDAYSKLESWLTVLFSNAPTKISYKKIGRSFLYTHNIPQSDEPKSNVGLIIERRLSLLNPLNLNIEFEVVPKLSVTVEEKQFVSNLFDEYKLDRNKKTVMISIIGSSANKTFPLGYMSKVVDYVSEKIDVNILFNYIPNQLDLAQKVYDHCAEKTQENIFFNLLGKNLREFIIIMDACDFIIGNDGGAINMAKALDKPSFIIFSPWIEKEMWSTFEDGKLHDSVHLKDYQPELFIGKTTKQLKENSIALYPNLKPSYFKTKLEGFLEYNFLENTTNQILTNFNKEYKIKVLQSISIVIDNVNEKNKLFYYLENFKNISNDIIFYNSSIDNINKLDYNARFYKENINEEKHLLDIKNKIYDFTSNTRILIVENNEINEDVFTNIKNAFYKIDNNFINYFIIYNHLIHHYSFNILQLLKSGRSNIINKNNDKEYSKINNLYFSINGFQSLINIKEYYAWKNAYKNYNSRRISYFHLLIIPFYQFFKSYIIKGGIKYGIRGLVVSSIQAYSYFSKYVKIYLLQKQLQ